MISSKRGPTSNLTIFGFLLALGALIHKTYMWEGLSSPLPLLTTGLCVALLFKPDAPLLLLTFAVATLAEASWYAPFYFSNHMTLVAFLCLGIVGATAALYAKEKRLAFSPAELEPYLFPLFRAGLYAMFALVVLHKLNKGFFDTTISCAVLHYANLRSRIPFIPDLGPLSGAGSIPIVATVFTEASIPVLLFFRRTRQLGLIEAFGFHYVMAINGFHTYSAVALPIYLAFLPREFHRDVAAFLTVLHRRRFGALLCRGFPIAMLVLAVGMTLAQAAGRTYQMSRMGILLCLLSMPPIIFIYLRLAFRRRSRPLRLRPSASGMPMAAWQIALLVLFVGHGLEPYLGLNTEAVFSMFSNLQTEEGRWNHLILPESLRIVGFQDSPVTITAISGMTLLSPWERHYLQDSVRNSNVFIVTKFELKRQIAAHCRAGQRPIALSYKIDGKSFDLSDACADPELSAGNGWLLEKIFWFRAVYDSSYPCQH